MMSYEPLFRTMKEKGITSYQLQKMGFNRATYSSVVLPPPSDSEPVLPPVVLLKV